MKAQDEVREKRLPSRDQDWRKLSKLLALSVVPEADKRRWATQFTAAYAESPGIDHETAKTLLLYIAPGLRERQLKKILAAPEEDAPEDSAATERSFPTQAYQSPKDDFHATIPAAWTPWASSIDQDFSAYVFSDPVATKRGLMLLWYRGYAPHSTVDGKKEMFANADDYAQSIVGKRITEENIVESRRQEKISGHVYDAFAGTWRYSCSIPELCDGRYYRFAVTQVGGGMYVLIGASESVSDKEAGDYFREFVRSFDPLKAGPDGDAITTH
jgi:hypothetical protein